MTDNAIKTSLTYNLARAHRHLHGDLDVLLQRENVSVEQWRVLEHLGLHSGQSMGELAKHVLMNHPALTKLADRLVANGLIHRVADPEDQRRVLVHLTTRGVALLERLRPIADEHNQRVEQLFGTSKTAALNALLEDISRGASELEEAREAITDGRKELVTS